MVVPTVSGFSGKVRFAIPKGSLIKDTISLLEQASYEMRGEERSYKPQINDPDIFLKILRPQEIPILVCDGAYDIGITGLDWVLETGVDVEVLAKLGYGRVDLVLACPKWFNVSTADELLRWKLSEEGVFRVSTEYLNLASEYLRSLDSYRELVGKEPPTIITPWWRRKGAEEVKIFLSFGATEAKPPEDADAVFDNMSTGITLYQNNLKVVGRALTSEAVLVANKESLRSWKREKILDVKTLLKGVVDARTRLHIFVNVSEENLPKLLEVLPALKGPTIAPLSRKGWYSVNTVVDRRELFRIMAMIRKLAQGLVVHEPRQVLLLDEGGE